MNDVIHLSCQQSYELLQSDPTAVLIDIRASMEFLFVGHPIGAVHIAWLDEPDWDVNPDFVSEITKLVERKGAENPLDTPIILICRSGVRSLDAGRYLIKKGFTHISHVDEGFEGDKDEHDHRSTVGGWRFRGLPWEQC